MPQGPPPPQPPVSPVAWLRALTVSSSSRASPSPVALLKLLVLEEEREMLGLLQSFSLRNGLVTGGRGTALEERRRDERRDAGRRGDGRRGEDGRRGDEREGEERFTEHMHTSCTPCVHVQCFVCGSSHLSLLGQISGELGLDDVSDLPSCPSGQMSGVFWSL